MNTIKTERVTVEITAYSPGDGEHGTWTVDGLGIPGRDGLAVTPKNGRANNGYVITHVPSGRTLGLPFKRQWEAVSIMASLYALDIPWTLRQKHIRRFVLGNQARYAKLRQVLYGRD